MSDGTICDTCHSRPHASDCPMREDALRERVAVLESKLDSRQKLLRRIWHDLRDRATLKGSEAVELSASIYEELKGALNDDT